MQIFFNILRGYTDINWRPWWPLNFFKLDNSKCSFRFKNTFKWSIAGLADLVGAKYFEKEGSAIRYKGRVRDINLETLYAMVTDNKLSAIGNEILWQSIIDLDKNLEFESF